MTQKQARHMLTNASFWHKVCNIQQSFGGWGGGGGVGSLLNKGGAIWDLIRQPECTCPCLRACAGAYAMFDLHLET